MERVYGPYQDRASWRVVVVRGAGEDSQRATFSCPTEADATALIDDLRRQAAARTVEAVVTEYLVWMKAEGRTERTLETTQQRLAGLLGPVWGSSFSCVSTRDAVELYGRYAARVAVDTHRNALGQVRTLWRWALKGGRRWSKSNVWEEVEGTGRRHKGKPQIRVDEARKLWSWIEPRLEDDRSLAVGIALLMGLRASEIVRLTPRDVDAGGTMLWVPGTKSDAAERQLELQPELRGAMYARAARERLLPYRREWVRDAARWASSSAGVPQVGAHSLRGLHATLRVQWDAVSKAMGHAGTAVTLAHYLAPGTVERVTAGRVFSAVVPQNVDS